MTATARDLDRGQHRLDLPLPNSRPLVPVEAVIVCLDREPDDVAMLIEQRYLRYAFDIRSERGEDGELITRAYPRVWRESVLEYYRTSGAGDYRTLLTDRFPATPHEEKTFAAATRRLIESFLPHRKPALRVTEVGRVLSCTKEHVNNLVADRLLVASKASTVNTSAEITRESFIQFLLNRRMP